MVDNKNDDNSEEYQKKYDFVKAVNNRSRNFEGRDSEFSQRGERKFAQNQREIHANIKGSGVLAQLEYGRQNLKEGISHLYSKTSQPSLVLLEHLDVLIRGGGEALKRDDQGNAIEIKDSPEIERLRTKATELYAEVMDIGKSIKRGYRDKIKGDDLFTEMSQKIKSEIIEPLAAHYNKNEGRTAIPKEEAFFKLAVLEKNLIAGDKTYDL